MTDDRLAKVITEIKRLKEIAEYNLSHSKMDRGAWMQQASVCTKLLSFIDSMQKEPLSENLEEAIRKYEQRLEKENPATEAYDFASAIRFGANWQKEQMMAKAVDIEVKVDAGGYPYIPQMELYDYDKDIPLAKKGDKYKVILIKE